MLPLTLLFGQDRLQVSHVVMPILHNPTYSAQISTNVHRVVTVLIQNQYPALVKYRSECKDVRSVSRAGNTTKVCVEESRNFSLQGTLEIRRVDRNTNWEAVQTYLMQSFRFLCHFVKSSIVVVTRMNDGLDTSLVMLNFG